MAAPSRFSGSDGVSAVRWLRSLIHDLPADLTPGQWLERVDGLLVGDAARWAEQHPDIKRIVADEHLGDATAEDVDTFKKVFRARFAPPEYLNMDDVDLQLLTLKQHPFESIEAYYQRTEMLLAALLHVSGVVDGTDVHLEQSCLKRIIGNFMHGIRDTVASRETVAYVEQCITQHQEYSLHDVYEHTEGQMQQPQNRREVADQVRSPGTTAFSESSSHPPELSYRGLFGSSEKAHDSYTRSGYGPHDEYVMGEIRSLIVCAHGCFSVPPAIATSAFRLLGVLITDAYKDDLPKIGPSTTAGASIPHQPMAETLAGLLSAPSTNKEPNNVVTGNGLVASSSSSKTTHSAATAGSSISSSPSNAAATSGSKIFAGASISYPNFSIWSSSRNPFVALEDFAKSKSAPTLQFETPSITTASETSGATSLVNREIPSEPPAFTHKTRGFGRIYGSNINTTIDATKSTEASNDTTTGSNTAVAPSVFAGLKLTADTAHNEASSIHPYSNSQPTPEIFATWVSKNEDERTTDLKLRLGSSIVGDETSSRSSSSDPFPSTSCTPSERKNRVESD